jgi:gamma-glutamylcyclotransferase (GGCT)/AIG2-like uncharacterized protein YtfP
MRSGINHIIFYGTLMGADGSRGMSHSPQLTFCGNITISGVLFSVGGFPALVMGGGNIRDTSAVKAELYKINDQEFVSRRYDGIEGYSGRKDGDMYTRTVVHVLDPSSNEVVDAWVYTWNSSTEGLKLIDSGSWLER